MASIKEILSAYGTAARAKYPQDDDVEDDMDYIVSFIEQHGYEFQEVAWNYWQRRLQR